VVLPVEEPAPEPPPLESFQIPVNDQVLELAAVREGGAPGLLVLGRRALLLYRVDPAQGWIVDRVDLVSRIAPDARLDRRALACLQLVTPPDDGPSRLLHLFSTALGVRSLGEASFHLADGRLIAADSEWLEDEGAPGPCDAFHEGLHRGWAGRPLLLFSPRAGALLFHLDHDDHLAVTSGPESGRAFPWASGEPLLAQGDPEGARLYVSSPALPGVPDHVREYVWDGEDLEERRRSHAFPGRLSAMAFLPEDGRAVLAEVTGSGSSILRILKEEELWAEPVP
jgi:hypothetical protein